MNTHECDGESVLPEVEYFELPENVRRAMKKTAERRRMNTHECEYMRKIVWPICTTVFGCVVMYLVVLLLWVIAAESVMSRAEPEQYRGKFDDVVDSFVSPPPPPERAPTMLGKHD